MPSCTSVYHVGVSARWARFFNVARFHNAAFSKNLEVSTIHSWSWMVSRLQVNVIPSNR